MNHPRRRTDINSQVVEGEAIVLDRQHEVIHQLNLTATYIWERCDGTASIKDIAAQLAETFAVAYEIAFKDVVQVIRQFQDLQLLDINRDQPVCSNL
jgi:hypothetical protein